jgi:predicted dehydrogenase
MPNIVFIDHDIDNYHANTFADLLAEGDSGFRLAGVFANRKDNLPAWAEKRGVPAFESVEAMASVADYVMVLAPSNPETHLELCRRAFSLGKPTYVDKTFAPDLATAKQIFCKADQQGVPIQTSSVLRYTEVQDYCRSAATRAPRSINMWASGGDFDEYVIHPIEQVVSLMGPEIHEIAVTEISGYRRIDLGFSGNRSASIHMHVNHNTPFLTVVTNDEETKAIEVNGGRLFASGLNGILAFFRNPTDPIDRQETLAIMKVLEILRTGKGRF